MALPEYLMDKDWRTAVIATAYQLSDSLDAIANHLMIFDGPNDPSVDIEGAIRDLRHECVDALHFADELTPVLVTVANGVGLGGVDNEPTNP